MSSSLLIFRPFGEDFALIGGLESVSLVSAMASASWEPCANHSIAAERSLIDGVLQYRDATNSQCALAETSTESLANLAYKFPVARSEIVEEASLRLSF